MRSSVMFEFKKIPSTELDMIIHNIAQEANPNETIKKECENGREYF